MKYRMYVDEVGNPDLGASENPIHRYLSLTGVIFELDYVASILQPAVEDLKRRYFGSHPDEPIVLHRKELLNRRPPFEALRDPVRGCAFDAELLALLESLDYQVVSVLIDKLEHKKRYQVWRFDPYHYCMTVLVERFALSLSRRKRKGDVMAESRGGREDRRLKASFERIATEGTEHLSADRFREVLTSTELKVKPKLNNIAGLQIADLVAYPAYRYMLAKLTSTEQDDNFSKKISGILTEKKFERSPDGVVEGWGIKLLP